MGVKYKKPRSELSRAIEKFALKIILICSRPIRLAYACPWPCGWPILFCH